VHEEDQPRRPNSVAMLVKKRPVCAQRREAGRVPGQSQVQSHCDGLDAQDCCSTVEHAGDEGAPPHARFERDAQLAIEQLAESPRWSVGSRQNGRPSSIPAGGQERKGVVDIESRRRRALARLR
jgi:hypothetical protein